MICTCQKYFVPLYSKLSIMKLKLDVSSESKKRQEELLEALQTELAVELVNKDGVIMEADQKYASDFTQFELFQLGERTGECNENHRLTKPDEMTMQWRYASLLEEALEAVENETHVQNTTVEFKKTEGRSTEIIIEPTDIRFLFNWFRKYGEMCVARQSEIDRLNKEDWEKERAAKMESQA